MRTACEPVQYADAEGGMRMLIMSLFLLVRDATGMGMHVQMAIAIVFVFVGVNAKGFAQGPGANSNEHQTHQALAPDGKEVHWNQIAQPKRKQTDDCHSC